MPGSTLTRIRASRTLPQIAFGDVLLAVVAYVPLLLTHRGMLGADTKAYLYLDPGRLLSKAVYLWDSSVAFGTVTHQNIGYLFPMGPYYWLMDAVGIPDWIAQRIWLGSIIFLAGSGVRYLLKTLSWDGPGVTVACFAYALSPYLLHYFYKHSVILLPFTALPWLVAFTAKSLRQPGWRYPAMFALVALAAGGINATSLFLVLFGPLLWVLHAVFVERELSIRQAIPPLLRIGVLGVATSLWWVVGLMVQGGYGIDVLKFTETYKTVSDASSSTEVSRALGYWFFYGTDSFGPWFKAADSYTQNTWVIALSYLVPLLAVASVLWTRFRYRVFFIGLAVLGLVASVGAYPLDAPSLYGRLFNSFVSSGAGLTLRSTPRAIPLLALALAVFLGAGVAALSRLRPERRLVFASVAIVLVMANLSPLFLGRMIDPYLERPNDVPRYWTEAAAHLDRGEQQTRALEIPGIDFSNYRWGSTVEPITPGLIDRDFAARELVPYGSEASANLLNAIDLPLQNRTLDPDSLAPLMRLMNVGDLVVRNDLEYERYRTPRPRVMQRWLARAVGFGRVRHFGSNAPNVAGSGSPLLDDLELSIPDDDPDPYNVDIYGVQQSIPIVHTTPTDRPQVLAGDGDGIVSAAEAGLVDPSRLLVYSGTVSGDGRLDDLAEAGAELIITDTNRKAGRRWGTTKDNDGYTELADEVPIDDPADNRLDLFGGRGTDVQTVARQVGGLRAVASGYGNPLSFTPGDRAFHAVDADPDTAWKVGAFSDVIGEWIDLRLEDESAPGSLTLVQAHRDVNRWITSVVLTFDGADPMVVDLTEDSRGVGQIIDLGDRRFTTLRITVRTTDADGRGTFANLSGVGFSTLRLGDIPASVEQIRPPTDLLDALGSRSDDLALSWVFRRRTAPADSGARDEETRLVRVATMESARTFAVSGAMRVDPDADDARIDELVGVGGATMNSSSGLRGDAASRASKAFDGRAATSWQSSLNPQPGEWLSFVTAEPVTATVNSISVLADGRHSVPTVVHFEVDGVALAPIRLPEAEDGPRGTVRRLAFDPVEFTGRDVRLVIDEFRSVTSPDWLSKAPTTLAVSVAEVGSTQLRSAVVATVPGLATCRSDLVSVGGTALAVVADGFADGARPADVLESAERGELVRFSACDPSGAGAVAVATLAEGETIVETSEAAVGALSVDRLVLSSGVDPTATSDSGPALTVSRKSPVHIVATPRADVSEPFWLVLGQSYNAGWQLRINGEVADQQMLANGFANAWYIDPARHGNTLRFEFVWTPQSRVWIGLFVSAFGLLLCIGLAFRPPAPSRSIPAPLQPSLIAWNDAYGRVIAALPATLWSLAATALGLFLLGGWWGFVVGAATFAALRTDLGWTVLRFATIALLGLAGAYVTAKQAANGYPLEFGWAGHFDRAHWPTMLAYCLIGVECLVEVLRGGWRRSVLRHS